MSLQSEYSLSGLRAVVCGASQGLGRAIAVELARQGASLVLLARSESKLKVTLQFLPHSPDRQHSFQSLDLTYTESVRVFSGEIAASGPVHILVNNSGGPAPGDVHTANPEEFQRALQGHLIAYQTLLQAFLPGMREARYGRIINILSTSVIQPLKGLGVSNTLRAAVANWAKTLAAELAPDGITVNNILPGMTRTERLTQLFEHRAAQRGISPAEVEAEALKHIPAGRFGNPEEIAAAVAFLASPAAGYINGVNLPVDGGRLAVQG